MKKVAAKFPKSENPTEEFAWGSRNVPTHAHTQPQVKKDWKETHVVLRVVFEMGGHFRNEPSR